MLVIRDTPEEIPRLQIWHYNEKVPLRVVASIDMDRACRQLEKIYSSALFWGYTGFSLFSSGEQEQFLTFCWHMSEFAGIRMSNRILPIMLQIFHLYQCEFGDSPAKNEELLWFSQTGDT